MLNSASCGLGGQCDVCDVRHGLGPQHDAATVVVRHRAGRPLAVEVPTRWLVGLLVALGAQAGGGPLTCSGARQHNVCAHVALPNTGPAAGACQGGSG